MPVLAGCSDVPPRATKHTTVQHSGQTAGVRP
jgi:hypothetical protein